MASSKTSGEPRRRQFTEEQRMEAVRKWLQLAAEGLFQKEAAAKIGVSSNQLRKWQRDYMAKEKPERPKTINLAKVQETPSPQISQMPKRNVLALLQTANNLLTLAMEQMGEQ